MKYSIIFIAFLFFTALATADIPANQTLETQGLQTHTDVTVTGLFTEDDAAVMQGATAALDNTLDPPGETWVSTMDYLQFKVGDVLFSFVPFGDIFFQPGEVQYTSSYNEQTLADHGVTTYTKSADIDTRNKPVNQNNFEAEKTVTFIGDASGQMVSSESLALDTAGNYSRTKQSFLCPFAAGNGAVTPQFCNIVAAGSDVSMKQVVLSTKAGDRFIAASADIPVALDYAVTINGPGSEPALGDVTAYMNVHSKEGRMSKIYEVDEGDLIGIVYRPGLGSDLSYSEKTSASGAIWTFQKDMAYVSGARRT
ncbi:MAG TPA: hypothetical protein PK445_07955 [Methanolinea sp.]|nr:hypothetical protein [Methanolinea sp.]HOS82643.1 hypothetical protein [Methanolinea sp.]